MAMLSRFIKLQPVPGKGIADFLARRAMLAAKLIKPKHKWSVIWAQRTRTWHDHVLRHPVHLCANLLAFRPEEWLRSRRNNFSCDTLSLTPRGRTNTRAARGKPCQRFEAGCEEARLYLSGLWICFEVFGACLLSLCSWVLFEFLLCCSSIRGLWLLRLHLSGF